MSDPKNYTLKCDTGAFKLTGMDANLTVTPAVINEAIEKSIEIPPGAKESIKDFITESFNELWRTAEELMSISPPLELSEYWEIVLQIIQSFM